MAINKNAIVRYNTLDKCFSNFGRKYYFPDILNRVNEALLELNPDSDGIRERQLRDDIAFMKSETGYGAPINAYREGKKAYYRYSDKDYSIHNSPLNPTEIKQLKNSIAVLQRFEGAPQFEWLNELSTVIQDRFNLKNDNRKTIGFHSNIDYTGYHLIPTIFDAISNQRVLEITYTNFEEKTYQFNFHPYFLKEYKHRWFVIGRNENLDNNQWVLALDRISNVKEIDSDYKIDNTDWEDYFYDIIGITRDKEGECVKVELKFNSQKAPYIETKPIHPSQKHKRLDDDSLYVELSIIPNFEFMEVIMSFGPQVELLAPASLREEIKLRANHLNELYNK